jgi:hypothetical protein
MYLPVSPGRLNPLTACFANLLQDAFRSPKPATLATSAFADAVFGKGHKAEDRASANKGAKNEELTWQVPGAASENSDTLQTSIDFSVRASPPEIVGDL